MPGRIDAPLAHAELPDQRWVHLVADREREQLGRLAALREVVELQRGDVHQQPLARRVRQHVLGWQAHALAGLRDPDVELVVEARHAFETEAMALCDIQKRVAGLHDVRACDANQVGGAAARGGR